MKNLAKFIFFIIAVTSSPGLRAQEKFDATGVWTGRIYNDSTKKDIPFELAISRKNGELSGYSYTVFMIDSVENIGVKEITIKEKNGMFITKDKKLIDDNYSDKPAKGVYTTIELSHSENDSADVFTGRWYTNKTREFYPLSGTVFLTKKRRIYETRIVQRLSYLGLANRLSFTQPGHNDDAVVNNKPAKSTTDGTKKEPMMTIVEPELVITLPKKDSAKSLKLPDAEHLAKLADIEKNQAGQETIKQQEKSVVANESEVANQAQGKNGQKKSDMRKTATTIEKMETGSVARQMVVDKNADAGKTATTGTHSEPVFKPDEMVTGNNNQMEAIQKPLIIPGDLVNRKIETIRSVNVVNDSIVLSLFDNGAIDGDTVSVLLNDRVIVSRVGLLARAFNHTIHLTPDMGDSIKIILYAENLGSIPPNTGLLVVRDGDKDYEIRFSGDLQKNSAIILRRNKKE